MSDTTDNCVTLNQTVFVVKEKDTMVWEPGTSGSGGYNIRVLQTLSNPRQVVTLSATMDGLVFDFDDTATSGSIVVVERELAVTANVAQEVSMGLAITQGTFVLLAVEEVNGNERLLASVTQQAGDVTTGGGSMHTQSMLLRIVPSTGNIKLRLSTIPMQVGNRNTATGRWITKKTKYLEQQNIAVTLCDSTADRYRFGFNGMEKDNELKGIGNSLDFGARMYDSRLGRWMSFDPLAHLRSWMNPYNFSQNSPIYRNDLTGMLDDVVITGPEAKNAEQELQKSVKGELKINRDEASGQVGYEQLVSDEKLSDDAKHLKKAIDDKSIISKVNAVNSDEVEGRTFVGGAQMGTTVIENIDNNGVENTIVESRQVINPLILKKLDASAGTKGKMTLHEVTEAYEIGLLSKSSGINETPATKAKYDDKNSSYYKAHSSARPQTATFTYEGLNSKKKRIKNSSMIYGESVEFIRYYVPFNDGRQKTIQISPVR